MAKRLLLNALVLVLGEFIELNEESLDLAVWSGSIILHDLKLKTETLLRNTDFNILQGKIKSLEIVVPWASLLSSPIKITINGVYMLVSPISNTDDDKAKSMASMHLEKQKKLQLVDRLFELSSSVNLPASKRDKTRGSSSEPVEQESYMQQWISKIVDNIEINLQNVHLRYEDSLSSPGVLFSVGLTLESFEVTTCDENWHSSASAFGASKVNRKKTGGSKGSNEGNSHESTMNKLAFLKHLGCYWQVRSPTFGNLVGTEWENSMQALIYTSAFKDTVIMSDELKYILSPYNNSLYMKLTRSKKSATKSALDEVEIESTNLQLLFDGDQYTQLFNLLDRLQSSKRNNQSCYFFKPSSRPGASVSVNRSWWRYACKLALAERRYIDLFKSSRFASSPISSAYTFTPADAISLRVLEERFPLEPLKLFRQRAFMEMAEEVRERQSKASTTSHTASWWGGWVGRGSTPAAPLSVPVSELNNDISIESIITKLNTSADEVVSMTEEQSRRLSVKLISSSTLVLSTGFKPIMKTNAAISISLHKSSAGFSFLCEFKEVLFTDKYTSNPATTTILSVQDTASQQQSSAAYYHLDEQKPTLSINFESMNGKSKITISALPIELTLNRPCINSLLNVFARPKNIYVSAKPVQSKKYRDQSPQSQSDSSEMNARVGTARRKLKARLSTSAIDRIISQQGDNLEISFEAKAPKILIPEYSSSDKGHLLLDTGHISITGFIGASGISMNVAITDINAGLPLSIHDKVNLGEKSLYLIKPFDVYVSVQNIKRVSAELSVSLELKPELRGEIDSVKLARLLRVVKEVSLTFVRQSNDQSATKLDQQKPPLFDVMMYKPTCAVMSPDKDVISDNGSEGFLTPIRQSNSPNQQGLFQVSDKDSIRAEILSGDFNRRLKAVRQAPSQEAVVVVMPMSAKSDTSNYYELSATCATEPADSIWKSLSPSAPIDKEAQENSDLFPWRDVESPTAEKLQTKKHSATEQFVDPNLVQMEVEIKLPVVSLDLTYDVAMGSHLILSVRKLEATMLTRAYDRKILFDLSELSIQDSFRAESQSYLAWTPTEFGNLIHVSYVSLFSRKSPLYSKYGTEVNIDFAHLCLNIDVNTLLHLKPFFDVLLGKNTNSPSNSDTKESSENLHNDKSNNSSNNSLPFTPVQNSGQLKNGFSPTGTRATDETSPSGMLVTAQLSKISLDILRCPALEKKGILLEPTFSIEISKLSAVVNFMELLTASIRLKSFLIRDIRTLSEDYIYRIVMLPTVEDTSGLPMQTADGAASIDAQQPPLSSFGSSGRPIAEGTQDENLLNLSYRQVSKSHSELTVNVSNVTSFVSLDAVLDLLSIASANFFTLLTIVSGNNAKKVDSESKSRAGLQRSVDSAEASRVTMSVLMNVNTPRIILLEDPSSRDSKAIVCRCGIVTQYTRETATADPFKKLNVVFTDSLHVSLQKVEVFVIHSMSEWKQKFVLQPVDIECHCKRKSVDSVLESSHFTIEMDNVDARLSFHDLVLASTILSRRALIESTPAPKSKPSSAVEVRNKKSAHTIYDRAESYSMDEEAPARQRSHSKLSSSPLISYRFGLSSLVLVTVNDFDGQNIPILKMSLEETKVSYEQDKFSSHGEGSVDLSLDFYNSKINLWEPLLERWLPTLRVYSQRGTQTIEISSNQTLQLTVSGIMLETLMRSYTLLFQQYSGGRGEHGNSDIAATTSSLSNIEVHNCLGDDVGIELQDSTTGQSLLVLVPVEHGGSSQGILKSDRPTSSSSSRIEVKRALSGLYLSELKLTSVNLHFLGYLEGERHSLLHLPLNLAKPKAYTLAPKVKEPRAFNNSKIIPTAADSSKSAVVDTLYERLASEQPILLEPVVEEVYQNSRYDPLSGQWKPPYLFGDPYEWTDATGSRRKDLSSIDIRTFEPSCFQWVWESNNWEIDKSSTVGVEIDEEGWEYGTSFVSFSVTTMQRTLQSMDCVRRRRYIRTRVPVKYNGDGALFASNELDEMNTSIYNKKTAFLPYTIFWDVQTLRNGEKRVCVRSGLQIRNHLSYSIKVHLSSSAWVDNIEMGPIESDEVFSVPLRYCSAYSIRFKPDNLPYEWSAQISCAIRPTDYAAIFTDINCRGNDIACTSFRVMHEQENKSLMISLLPFVVISNKLPCNLLFQCSTTDSYSSYAGPEANSSYESGIVRSGSKMKLSHANFLYQPKLMVKVGRYSWSEAKRISVQDEVSTMLFECRLPKNLLEQPTRNLANLEGRELVLSCKTTFVDKQYLEVTIFSKVVVVDRTRLDVSIFAHSRNLNRGILRHTWAPNSVEDVEDTTTNKSPISLSSTLSQGLRKSRSDMDLITQKLSDKVVSNLSVCSKRKYEFSQASIGSHIYTDRKIRWSHFPPIFANQLQLKTPFEDMAARSSKIAQFTLVQASIVFIFADVKCPPSWIETDDFRIIHELAVGSRLKSGFVEEFHYSIYGKYYEAGDVLVLKGNWNKQMSTMYSLFVIPFKKLVDLERSGPKSVSYFGSVKPKIHSRTGNYLDNCDNEKSSQSTFIRRIIEEVRFLNTFDEDVKSQVWSEGGCNLTLMHSDDNLLSVGLCKGTVWSPDAISIDTKKNSATKGSFEVEDRDRQLTYCLSYSLQQLPGFYSDSQVITFLPYYCILNCMDENVFFTQKNSKSICEYQPYSPSAWHKLDSIRGTSVHIRTQSTIWSLGCIDLNELGTSVIHIPHKSYDANISIGPGEKDNLSVFGGVVGGSYAGGIVIQVEVKMAESSDNCSVVVIIKRETAAVKTAMLIQNDAEVPVTVRQADIELDHNLADTELYEMVVPPSNRSPFGWADPESGSMVLIAVGVGLKGNNRRIASINMLRTDQQLRLPYNFGKGGGGSGEVVVSANAINGTKVIQISKVEKLQPFDYKRHGNDDPLSPVAQKAPTHQNRSIVLLLSSLGVSLVVERPTRRELFSLYIAGLELTLRFGQIRSLEFVISDLQIDNYSESAMYPVLLHSKRKDLQHSEVGRSLKIQDVNPTGRQAADDLAGDASNMELPFIQLTIVQDISDESPKFSYIAFRMISFEVEVDSATLQLLFIDFLDDLKLLSRAQALALSLPGTWIAEYNSNLMSPTNRFKILDNLLSTKFNAQRSKIYFKNLIIHPIKVTLTFTQTIFPRRKGRETLQSTVLNVLTALVGVDKLQLRLKSFEVEDAMESWHTLRDLIAQKAGQDLRSQLTQIAGSLTMLGSPIGLARKVGSGVKAFFYEPYLGAVHGSQDFVIGLGKGTTRLISGVVSGAMDSAAAIADTATKGFSYLSGDADYIRERSLIKQQFRANRAGIIESINYGSESFVSGVASGVSGLISKPIEEGYKNGLPGLLKGIGLGLIGAAVKPLMGVTDGISSLANGIVNQVNINKVYCHVRPPRALDATNTDSMILAISPLNLAAALAQDFVIKRARQNNYDDTFISYIPLETAGEAVILTSIYIFWRRQKNLWGRVWANVSHCVLLGDAVGIILYTAEASSTPELVIIPCASFACAKLLYSSVAVNAFRMGNPTSVVSVDVIFNSALFEQILTSHVTSSIVGESILLQLSRLSAQLSDSRTVSLLGELDGYRFGAANFFPLKPITGSEEDVLKRAQYFIGKGYKSWSELDSLLWRLLWEWECVHSGFCRCSILVLINRSGSPIQLDRVQLLLGRKILFFGTADTGYLPQYRIVQPMGVVVLFICAILQSPLEVGHIKVKVDSGALSAIITSTQRETYCIGKGGYRVGFLEKIAKDWWSKYIVAVY